VKGASDVINKIARLDPSESRRPLGELLDALPFTNPNSYDDKQYLELTKSWLRALDRAAASLNQGVAVVESKDVAPAYYPTYHGEGKGDRDKPTNIERIERDAAIYREAFEGREKARKQLIAFFSQK
jgi:hypothetical protein